MRSFVLERGEMVDLAVRLKQLRVASGKSLQEVADAVKASKAHVWDLERGASKNPSLDLLKRLSDFYQVSVAELIGENPNQPDESKLVVMYRNLTELNADERETIQLLMERLKASRPKE
jgi:transcriptional regulator with XRE-family HTH domain